MSIPKNVTQILKSERLNLSEEDQQNIIRFLNTLAKIEYEDYRNKKSISKQTQKSIEVNELLN